MLGNEGADRVMDERPGDCEVIARLRKIDADKLRLVRELSLRERQCARDGWLLELALAVYVLALLMALGFLILNQ